MIKRDLIELIFSCRIANDDIILGQLQEGYLTTNLNVAKGLANGTPVVYDALVIENESDKEKIRTARSGEVVNLSEPPKAIVIRIEEKDGQTKNQ